MTDRAFLAATLFFEGALVPLLHLTSLCLVFLQILRFWYLNGKFRAKCKSSQSKQGDDEFSFLGLFRDILLMWELFNFADIDIFFRLYFGSWWYYSWCFPFWDIHYQDLVGIFLAFLQWFSGFKCERHCKVYFMTAKKQRTFEMIVRYRY